MVLGLAAVLLALGAYLYYRGSASLPRIDGSTRLAGLAAPVEVLRDRYGVPHLFATSIPDLVRATGYVHAQDRYFQMELGRRLANGTMAEVLGAGLLPIDRRVRLLGLAHAARAELESMDPDAREIMVAYADGVNAYREEYLGHLPPEFQILDLEPEPWKPMDSLAIGKWMSYLLSSNGSIELLRANLSEKLGVEAAYSLTGLPPPPVDRPAWVLPQGDPFSPLRIGNPASNAWVVSGSRTASGKPLLASDPHLPLPIPSLWYEIHLAAGELNVAGASLPGVPFVLIGHNDRIAWGVTASYADVQDHYVERLNPDNPLQYAVGDQWEDVEVFEETIPVAGASPITLQTHRTRHGVVVSDEPREGRVLALRWDGLWSGDMTRGFLLLNQAGDWPEFTESLRWLGGFPLIFVYADVEGNIGWYPSGEIPIRSDFDGSAPVEGSSGAFEWQGYVAHESKPFALNPEDGCIVSANQNMLGATSPYLFGRDQLAPFRAERILALLTTARPLSVSDFERIQADRYDGSSERILRHLMSLTPDSDETRAAHSLLRGWDGQMGSGPAPAIYQAFYFKVHENTLKDDLGEEIYTDFLEFVEMGYPGGVTGIIDDPTSTWWDEGATPGVEDRNAIFKRSLSDAVDLLAERQGGRTEGWDWASLHAAVFEHPLGSRPPWSWFFNRGPVPFGGSGFTIANARVSLTQPFRVATGTSFRMVVDLGDLSASTATVTTGASGHPLSTHYFDQNKDWLEATNHPVLFDRSRIEAALEGRLTLTP